MIRVMGGDWKGRRLHVSKEVGTRPSSARLREALFSSLASSICDATVFDLFAGCGALGIEALSRGARHATFIELDKRAVLSIRKNLEMLAVPPERFAVRRVDARRWLTKRAEEAENHTAASVYLLDPPYQAEVIADLLPLGRRLVESSPLAIFAIEHRSSVDTGLSGEGIEQRTRRHGESAFTVLEKGRPT